MSKDEVIGNRFIEILEIIYAIILACGVAKMLEIFTKDYSNNPFKIWLSIVISIFALIRFFFAPSKNIKILLTKAKKGIISIMPIDVPILLVHSFIFYLMCLEVKNVEIFYRWFHILLAVNAIWLFTIWIRLRKESIPYIKIWSINNSGFFVLYIITYYILGIHLWLIWFIFAISNSMIDIFLTHSYYFAD